MQNVTVKKQDLITKLLASKEKHEKEYRESVIDFRKAINIHLERASSKVKGVKDPVTLKKLKSFYINIPAPFHYLDSYDQVLAMLNMSVEDNITLTFNEFQQYVQDKWLGARQFASNKALYASTVSGTMLTEMSLGEEDSEEEED